jgi:hypothetical protein
MTFTKVLIGVFRSSLLNSVLIGHIFLILIFELTHINNTRGFIVIIPYMHTVYFEQDYSLHYIPIPPSLLPPFSSSVLWVS